MRRHHFGNPDDFGGGDFDGAHGHPFGWSGSPRGDGPRGRGGRGSGGFGGGRGAGGPFGGGPGGPFGGGFGGPMGGGFGRFARQMFAQGMRARRGNIRAAVLALLAEEPRNGYQLMQEIEKRSQGAWRPSSGSVYPTLQQLEDEGLVRVEESHGSRNFQLTTEGQKYVKEHADELKAPWELEGGGGDRERMAELGHLVFELVGAAKQVSASGNPTHQAAAKKILKDARRALYRLLSEDEDEDAGEGSAE